MLSHLAHPTIVNINGPAENEIIANKHLLQRDMSPSQRCHISLQVSFLACQATGLRSPLLTACSHLRELGSLSK